MVARAAGQTEAHAALPGAPAVERGGYNCKHNAAGFTLLDAAPGVLEASEQVSSPAVTLIENMEYKASEPFHWECTPLRTSEKRSWHDSR